MWTYFSLRFRVQIKYLQPGAEQYVQSYTNMGILLTPMTTIFDYSRQILNASHLFDTFF